MENKFRDDRVCFVCGEKNAAGLKLHIRTDADRGESTAEVTFPEYLQGWAKVVHGGLLATVLDEAMIYAAKAKGLICVTGELTVRFVKPAATGVVYALRGRFVEDKGRIVLAESELRDSEGLEVARATGKLFKVQAQSVSSIAKITPKNHI
ncbi:MAG: PaaI family thioesterase [Candidatus Aminicenantes bacterium]|nr:PaaI family thioesterase [Candidatus Aminicenantes bacterium]